MLPAIDFCVRLYNYKVIPASQCESSGLTYHREETCPCGLSNILNLLRGQHLIE
jgi:hypothetical protein